MNNNITEDYCSFEVSKLLKEKGFEVNTLFFYWGNGQEGNGRIGKLGSYDNCYIRAKYDYKEENICPMPTHALAIKWIRENFGIHIEIRHIKTFGINRFHIIIWKYGEKDYHTIHCDNKIGYEVWDKPEEATEAALLYTLKHLI